MKALDGYDLNRAAELVAEEFASRCWYCAELAGRLHEWWTTGDDWFVNADKDREPGEDPILESERWAQATHGEKVDRVASQLRSHPILVMAASPLFVVVDLLEQSTRREFSTLLDAIACADQLLVAHELAKILAEAEPPAGPVH